MLVHLYSSITHEFVGSTFADQDPLNPEGILVPAFATTVEPPVVKEREKALFDPDSGTWSIVSDFRAVQFYRKLNGQPVDRLSLAERPDPEVVTEVPPPTLQKNQTFVWNEREHDWRIVADFRGQTVFDKVSGCARSVTEVGPICDDVTLLPPPSSDHVWDKHKWVKDEAKVMARQQLAVKEELKQNDVETVRAIREWLLTDGSGTKDLKTKLQERERQAVGLRQKLKEA